MKDFNDKIVVSNSEAETVAIAASFSSSLEKGDVVGLVGDLGAGKTCFTRGIAIGIGVKDPFVVTSPTFVLMQSYEGRLVINHYDLYRIEAPELSSLGFYEEKENSISIIEWADKLGERQPRNYMRVELSIVSSTKREIRFVPVGNLNPRLANFVLDI